MKKIDAKTVAFQNKIKEYLETLTTDKIDEKTNEVIKATYELKTYDSIANCVTIKYNKHVVTDVYYTTSNIRLSTKSAFFTDSDLSIKENRDELCKTFDDCNIIKNVTDFQIRTTKKDDLTKVIKQAKKFYDTKEKAKQAKSAKKEKASANNDNISNEGALASA